MKNVKSGHSKPIVCLDAGHYGKYNRSPVVPEYYESDMNWKLHLLLKRRLEELGITVTTTRANKDQDLEVTARGKKANHADLFLSLHSNAASREAPNWVVGIYFVDDDCGVIDENSKYLAGLLAEGVAKAMGVGHEIFTKESSADRDRNGTKDDYYGVLRGAHSVGATGVILEHGFHTNTANAKWLLKDENLELLAKVEAGIIADWFGISQESAQTFSLPLLKKGAKTDPVKAMQILLIGYGYSCGSYGADGDFGSATDKAVRRYQTDHNLVSDGIVGPLTWNSLLGLD